MRKEIGTGILWMILLIMPYVVINVKNWFFFSYDLRTVVCHVLLLTTGSLIGHVPTY